MRLSNLSGQLVSERLGTLVYRDGSCQGGNIFFYSPAFFGWSHNLIDIDINRRKMNFISIEDP